MPSNFIFDELDNHLTYDFDDVFIKKTFFTEYGQLWGYGANFIGQLGNGTTNDEISPIQLGSSTILWKDIGLRFRSSAGIKSDGTLWTWGENNQGQLGDGTTTNKSSPVQIGSATNWKQVACGYYFMATIKKDNTLWTWGNNRYGGLGDGTIVKKSSPIQVGSLTDWKQVSCGYYHISAVKTNGTLWTCGYNSAGQLGDGTLVHNSSPIQVGSLTDWKSVACGYSWTLALKTDGTLWGWGTNWWGQLGNGISNNYYVSPIQIGSLTDWKQISTGYYHSAATKTDGTLWIWGLGTYARLGLGDLTSKSSPTQVGALNNWKQVSCIYNNTAAIKTDGTLWICGDNTWGLLDDGSAGSYGVSSFIQVGSLTNWKRVESSYVDILALKYY